MDEKSVKSLLKNARENIQNKNIKEALKLCEQILKIQPENYMALVFAGRCHVELDDPTAARDKYLRATALDSEQLLAWQGLLQFYEKYCIWDDNSVSCLKKLIDLTSDEKKKWDYKFQLATILAKSGRFDESATEFLSIPTDGQKSDLEETVVRLLGEAGLNVQDGLEFVKKCFVSCIERNVKDENERTVVQAKYGRFLVKNQGYNEAYELFTKMGVSKDYGISYLSDILTVLCERYIEDSLNDTDEETLNQLDVCFEDENLDSTSHEAATLTISALLDLISGNWIGVVETLTEDELKSQKCPFLWYILAGAKFHLHDYNDALKASEEAQHFWKDAQHFLHLLKSSLIEADCNLEIHSTSSLKKASEIYNTILLNSSKLKNEKICQKLIRKCNLGLAVVSALDGSLDKALDYLKKIMDGENIDYYITEARVYLQVGNYVQCKITISNALEISDTLEDEEKAILYYLRGRSVWDCGEEKNEAVKDFLQAAKLDAYHGDTFFYMGQYYDQLNCVGYKEKWVKCLERAFSLAGRYNWKIGCALSDAYRKIDAHEKNLALLSEITGTQSVENVTWAWLRLGLEYLSEEKADDAVTVLQTVLRFVDTDARCWECLGEAYAIRGSYGSALKALEKVIQLESDQSKRIYAQYRAACINLIMNRFNEAMDQFWEILKMDGSHLPSLIGFGNSTFQLGKFYFINGRFQRALDSMVDTIEKLGPVVISNPNCPSAWYLLGNALTFLETFPNGYLEKINLVKLLRLFQNEKDLKNGKLGLLRFGSRCLAQAIGRNPKIAHIWHALGMNLFFQLTGSENWNDELISQCLNCLKHAIRLDPVEPKFWLSLANVTTSKTISQEELAQHCFIKSLQLEPHQPSAWTGLGILYKKFGELQLAHACFQRAQSIDPDYNNCWIGQALIAEEVKPKEALDLFRHAVELGNNVQSLLGYGYHVLQTILDPSVNVSSAEYQYAIQHNHAIPTAQIGLQKYCWLNPTDPCALNMLALFLELEKMLVLSSSTYLNALDVLKESSSGNGDLEELITGNACRVFGKMGNSGMMRRLAGKMTTKNTLENACMRALAYYRLGQYDKALELYSESTYWTKSKEDQIALDCAFALIAAKQDDWKKSWELCKEENDHSNPPVIFWTTVCNLFQTGKVDMMKLRCGFIRLSQLPDATAWLNLLIAVCCLYTEAFSPKSAQWLLHCFPYHQCVRIMFHRIFCKPPIQLLGHTPVPEMDKLARWQALCELKECKGKETFYAKIKHQYPDIFTVT